MRKLNKDQVVGIIGLIIILIVVIGLINGGMDKIVEHDMKQLEAIINNT